MRLSGKVGYATALAIGLLIVALVFALSEPVESISILLGTRVEYIALACLLDFVSIVLYALAWIATAKALSVNIGLADGLVASILGITADKLVASASVSCEVVRFAYVKWKRNDVRYSDLVATLIVHRFLYNVAFIALLAGALVDLAASGSLNHAIFAISSLAVASTLAASYILVKPESLKRLICPLVGLLNRVAARTRVCQLNPSLKVEEAISEISLSVRRAWGSKWLMVAAIALMILQWAAGSVGLGALFHSVGYRVSAWTLLITFPLHCYLSALPVGIPAALGVTEAGTVLLLSAFGVDRAAAMAVTLLLRLVEVWFELALGAVVALLAGLRNVRAIARGLRVGHVQSQLGGRSHVQLEGTINR